jgi:hypothetical protein
MSYKNLDHAAKELAEINETRARMIREQNKKLARRGEVIDRHDAVMDAQRERLVEQGNKLEADLEAKYEAKVMGDEKQKTEAHQRMNYPRPSKTLEMIAKDEGDETDQEALELILSTFGRDLILLDLFKCVIIPMQEKIAKLEDELGALRHGPEYHDRKKLADRFLQQYREQHDLAFKHDSD